MSHYRKIDVRVWNDAKFMSLTMEGQLAWFMLLTHPMMTALGAMRGTPSGLAEELSRDSEGMLVAYRDAIQDIIDKGMADYDQRASMIALPNFLKYNRPESINVVKAWWKAAEMLPECELKNVTIQRAVAYAEAMGKGFKDAIRQAFPKAKPMPTAKASGMQRAESSGAESSDLGSALEEEDSTEGTYTREEKSPEPSMFTPYPIPSSAVEGRDFLISKGVPQPLLDECLRAMLGGNFGPFELEGVLSRARSEAA